MNNKEYGDKVLQEEYPEDVQVPLDTPFTDDRGVIQNLWLAQAGSVTLIKTKKGSFRAKHRHTFDWHGCYIVEGKIRYTEGEPGEPYEVDQVFSTNEMFFSRPKVFHTMEFLEDTIMITVNNIVKNHENYEKDIVRK